MASHQFCQSRYSPEDVLVFLQQRGADALWNVFAKGYPIGSGVVEATCRVPALRVGDVVAQQLDQAGMHWRQETAEAIVALRAAQRSTFPPDLRPYCAKMP